MTTENYEESVDIFLKKCIDANTRHLANITKENKILSDKVNELTKLVCQLQTDNANAVSACCCNQTCD